MSECPACGVDGAELEAHFSDGVEGYREINTVSSAKVCVMVQDGVTSVYSHDKMKVEIEERLPSEADVAP